MRSMSVSYHTYLLLVTHRHWVTQADPTPYDIACPDAGIVSEQPYDSLDRCRRQLEFLAGLDPDRLQDIPDAREDGYSGCTCEANDATP